ncbi:hypothetical protein PAECIP111891_02705 [Paenibacillus allorhizoplanae]|uniref:Endospore appendages core domain-containing protein n=1 Tax=Paenibacillus allorhizoplanae TaxID=2905648 RepID=A0ABM9C7L8_9BACL|nr:S-Ena type endospore appendage [Paenibacillus allorhizoplanae]CAH1205193.1 hypothetical protein PAECIP111891_02705 [Paenibacillus allorhizoplanae]
MIKKKGSAKKKVIELTIVHKTSSSCLSLNKGKVSRPKQTKGGDRRSLKRITHPVLPCSRSRYPTNKSKSEWNLNPKPNIKLIYKPMVNPCPSLKHHHCHPSPPPTPPAPLTTINKDCCGNILLQGNQPGFRIWEIDVESKIEVAQISIYSSSSSTQAIEVDIETDYADNKRLSIPPGSTINFIGQGVRAIDISSLRDEMAYVEGKYAISTTLQIQSEHPSCE